MSEIIRLVILVACSPVIAFGVLLFGRPFVIIVLVAITTYCVYDATKK